MKTKQMFNIFCLISTQLTIEGNVEFFLFNKYLNFLKCLHA